MDIENECKEHGFTPHRAKPVGRGYISYTCRLCIRASKKAAAREIKAKLVAHKGGSCENCGYDKSLHALQFHHIDPSTKSFEISDYIKRYSYDKLLSEAKKCALLCANCHAETHEKEDLKKKKSLD